MKKPMILAAIAAMAFAGFAGEHDTPQTSGDYVQLVAGEQVYAGNIAVVATNGCAYAVNTSNIDGTLTVCGVFQYSAAAGEKVLAKRGGFILENAASGTIEKKDIGATDEAIKAALAKALEKKPEPENQEEAKAAMSAAVKAAVAEAVKPIEEKVAALSAASVAHEKQDLIAEAAREGKVIALSADALAKISVEDLKTTIAKTAVTVPLNAKTPTNVRRMPAASK